MTRAIYLDDETRILEKEILEKNPKTNFSQIYKLAVFKLANKEPSKDISFKKSKLLELKTQSEYIKADMKVLINEIKGIQEEEEEKISHEKKEEEENTKSIIKQQAEYYKKYFHVKEDVSLNLSIDWMNQTKLTKVGWVEYGKSKGYDFDEKLWKEHY